MLKKTRYQITQESGLSTKEGGHNFKFQSRYVIFWQEMKPLASQFQDSSSMNNVQYYQVIKHIVTVIYLMPTEKKIEICFHFSENSSFH